MNQVLNQNHSIVIIIKQLYIFILKKMLLFLHFHVFFVVVYLGFK